MSKREPGVTKKDIVRTISDELDLTQQQTKEIVQRTLDLIIEALARDGRIELRNFGIFEVKRRAARRARNPLTNEVVPVPAKQVVTFKPGKLMEEKVQDLDFDGHQDHGENEGTSTEPNVDANPNSIQSTIQNLSGNWDD
ncbi:DNA-binding protein HU 1 [Stieleria bergensis]|uniref:DNA-binding protein HU 1 n=1 Tax=Stieleria bergensis TaxID=2528025 RepID=A0A517SSJ0_9BACT|nr:DNA-binding protein HU 1 [Planctomycetes bacterium SV_7m_r]